MPVERPQNLVFRANLWLLLDQRQRLVQQPAHIRFFEFVGLFAGVIQKISDDMIQPL
jgi:hypothetical protein